MNDLFSAAAVFGEANAIRDASNMKHTVTSYAFQKDPLQYPGCQLYGDLVPHPDLPNYTMLIVKTLCIDRTRNTNYINVADTVSLDCQDNISVLARLSVLEEAAQGSLSSTWRFQRTNIEAKFMGLVLPTMRQRRDEDTIGGYKIFSRK